MWKLFPATRVEREMWKRSLFSCDLLHQRFLSLLERRVESEVFPTSLSEIRSDLHKLSLKK